jgi:hypothetical protein
MYDFFFIDIRFKSSLSLSNFEAHSSVVSFLFSGVINTAQHGSVVSLTPPTTGLWCH